MEMMEMTQSRTKLVDVWGGSHIIRTARKPGRCDYWMGAAGRCPTEIKAGDRYVEGELRDGGYAMERWCFRHEEFFSND